MEGDPGHQINWEENSHLHPLQNSLILTKLFKLVQPQDLTNCRLVCKQWFDHSVGPWRSLKCISFDAQKIPSPGDPDGSSIVHRFLDFVEDPMNKYNERPHKELHLEGWKFQFGENGIFKEEWMERFCRGEVGRHITNLDLNVCTFKGVEEFRFIMYRFCPSLETLTIFGNCENLIDYPGMPCEPTEYKEPAYGEQTNCKTLTLQIHSRGSKGYIPVSWFEFFSHFPKLSSFQMWSNINIDESEILNLFKAIKLIKSQDGWMQASPQKY